MTKGYYAGGGYQWEPGEVPLCSMCNLNIATRTTAHSGIHLCDDPECHSMYVMGECDEIVLFEDEDEFERERDDDEGGR